MLGAVVSSGGTVWVEPGDVVWCVVAGGAVSCVVAGGTVSCVLDGGLVETDGVPGAGAGRGGTVGASAMG